MVKEKNAKFLKYLLIRLLIKGRGVPGVEKFLHLQKVESINNQSKELMLTHMQKKYFILFFKKRPFLAVQVLTPVSLCAWVTSGKTKRKKKGLVDKITDS